MLYWSSLCWVGNDTTPTLFHVFYVIIRGLSTGIYATTNPLGCYYVLENSRTDVVVVDEQEQLDKILQVKFYMFVQCQYFTNQTTLLTHTIRQQCL